MGLLHRSIAGAVLILVILVVRAVAVNRLPKAAFRALWAVAAARLLIPFSVPSRFSLYNIVAKLAGRIREKPWGSLNTDFWQTGAGADSGQMAGAYLPELTSVGVLPDGMIDGMAKSEGISVAASFSAVEVVYLSVACVFAACFLYSYFSCQKKFRMSLPVKHRAVEAWLAGKNRRKPEVRVLDQVSAPLTYGILHPVILLPKRMDWEDEKTLCYILDHEYMHILHFDAWNKIIFAGMLCIHWFNPLVWAMYFFANRDMELYCDETVVRMGGGAERESYALALLRMEELRRMPFSLHSYFSSNAMEERIVAIMKMRKNSILGAAFAVVLVAGTVTLFATSALAEDTKGEEGNPAVEDTKDKEGSPTVEADKEDGTGGENGMDGQINESFQASGTPTPVPGGEDGMDEQITDPLQALGTPTPGVLVTPLPAPGEGDGMTASFYASATPTPVPGGENGMDEQDVTSYEVLVTPLPIPDGEDGMDGQGTASPGISATPTPVPVEGRVDGQAVTPTDKMTVVGAILESGMILWNTKTNMPLFVETQEDWERILSDVESEKLKYYTLDVSGGEAKEIVDGEGNVQKRIYSNASLIDEDGNILFQGAFFEIPNRGAGIDTNSDTEYYMETIYYLNTPEE